MTGTDYKKLQNGSDIRGVSTEGYPGEIPNLTVKEATRIAMGFLLWLMNKTGKEASGIKVSIGRDPRITGMELKYGLLNGMGPYDVKILDCGLASTPAMFMSTIFPEFDCDGAIMITASHLPFNRNGFKFFSKDGGLDKEDITQILETASSDRALMKLKAQPVKKKPALDRMTKYTGRPVPLMETYCKHIRNMIKREVNHPVAYYHPLTGMKIVIDAGNGSGGFYADKILAPLGADTRGSRFLKPNGRFPNHAPNPEDEQAIKSICEAVIEKKADLGLIFDTDVDRSAAVDSSGKEIARNGIVAMAAALVADKHPGTTVVTDSITSTQLTDFLEKELGLKHLRFKRGYKNVINKAIELNEAGIDSQLAIETSGHAAFKENFFLDDGAYLAAKVVIKAAVLFLEGRKIDSVLARLQSPAEAVEMRIPIEVEDFAAAGDRIIEALAKWTRRQDGMHVVTPNYEGVRIAFNETGAAGVKGWCLLRKSLHDPLLPLNIESEVKGGCKKIADILLDALKEFDELDLEALLQQE